MPVAFQNLPFDEAIEFLRKKVNLPSEHWTDLWQGMHSRGFVVAGAMKNELLADIHGELNKAIAQGTTFADFKKSFKDIVAKHGWTGSPLSPVDTPGRLGWRAGVIFNTNMRTAYAAGGYKQMTDPAVLKARPNWRYIGGLSETPRPLHLTWDGTILKAGDPWWDTHYPPNGWGCKCKVVSVGNREMTRNGWKPSPQAPDDGTRDWKNPKTGKTAKVPNGIDPGWAYNPGQAAWGEPLALRAMRDFKGEKTGFTPLTHGTAPVGNVPRMDAAATLDYEIPASQEGMETALRTILGGPEKVYSFEDKGFRYDFNVNAKALAESLSDTPDRAPFLPLVPEVAGSPYEIWQSFEQNNRTKQVVLRHRFIKAVKTGGGEKGMVMVMDSSEGWLEALTFYPVRAGRMDKELGKKRRGKLIFREG